jgi:hypothetical protein
MLLIRTTGEKLHSDPYRLILEVGQEVGRLEQRAITTCGESVQTLQSCYKTDILVMLIDTSGLDAF